MQLSGIRDHDEIDINSIDNALYHIANDRAAFPYIAVGVPNFKDVGAELAGDLGESIGHQTTRSGRPVRNRAKD